MSVSVDDTFKHRNQRSRFGHVTTGAPRVDRRKWKAFKFNQQDTCKPTYFSTSVTLPYTPLVNTLQHCGHVANERIIAVSKSQLRDLGQIVLGYVVLGKRRLEPQVVDQPKEDCQCSGGIELQSIKKLTVE